MSQTRQTVINTVNRGLHKDLSAYLRMGASEDKTAESCFHAEESQKGPESASGE